VKVKRANVNDIAKQMLKRKLVALERAGAIVQSQAKALAAVGKYPAGSSKVGGALRDSIYLKMTEDSAQIGTNIEYGAMQEFGGVVTPYRAKALTIPIAAEAVGRRARDFDNLFIITINGNVYLAANNNGELKLFYLLLDSVTIPKQPYLRPALEASRDDIIKTLQTNG